MSDLMSTGGVVIDTPVNRDEILGLPVISNQDLGEQAKVADRLWIRTSVSGFDMLTPSDQTNPVYIPQGYWITPTMGIVNNSGYMRLTDNSGSYLLSDLVGGGGEPALGNPSVSGYVLSSTTGGIRSWIMGGSYPGAGIAVSTGSAWGTSITDASANWNTAYSHSQTSHQTIINGTGFVKASGTTLSYDNSTYLTAVTLNDIGNPTANKLFTMTSRQLTFRWTNPVPSDGVMELEVVGNFTGDVLHIHQHTGAPGAGSHGAHIETEHANVIPVYLQGNGGTIMELRNPAGTFSYTIVTGAISANRILNLPVITGTDTLVVNSDSRLHASGSDNETASSIIALSIDEIEFGVIKGYMI